MTYKGDRPIISSRTAMLITDIALITASFIMFQKIANVLSILSFIMVTSVIGGGYFGYKYVTSPEFQRTIKNKLMGDLQKKLPSVMKDTLPKTTGESFAIPKKIGL